VYAVITYYLRNKERVKAYLLEQDRQAEALRQKIQGEFPTNHLRERILKYQRKNTTQGES
jgi:hypothetical protein